MILKSCEVVSRLMSVPTDINFSAAVAPRPMHAMLLIESVMMIMMMMIMCVCVCVCYLATRQPRTGLTKVLSSSVDYRLVYILLLAIKATFALKDFSLTLC